MKGKKTGGRQKGTLNKTTAFTKELLTELLSDYQESGLLGDDFKKLEPKERIDAAIKFAGFILPKPQAIDMTVSGEIKKTIEDKLLQLAEENEV